MTAVWRVAAVVLHGVDGKFIGAVPRRIDRAEVTERIHMRPLCAGFTAQYFLHVGGMPRVLDAAGGARLKLQRFAERRTWHGVGDRVRQFVTFCSRRGQMLRTSKPGAGPDGVCHAALIGRGPGR